MSKTKCPICSGLGYTMRHNPWGAVAFFNGPYRKCEACKGRGSAETKWEK